MRIDISLPHINIIMYQSSQMQAVALGNPITKGLSVSSNDIIGNYNRLLTQIKDPITAEALKTVETTQNKREEELVASTTICDVATLSSLRDHIGGLQGVQMKEYTTKQLHNPAAMKAAMCTIDSIFYTSAYDTGSLYLNNRIRMYIHNLRQIGSESKEGYALLSDFENAKDMFVVKVARSPTDDSLLHELVVGLYGTNKLRQYIPNFAYIYGGFKCSPPLIDPDTKKVVTWCLHDENSVNYVLYENITPSISMAQFIKICSGKDFVNIYLQVLYALRLGLKVIDFTHYDMNYDNILLRTPDGSQRNVGSTGIGDPRQNLRFQIPYETERGVEYITTQVIPTITNYGFSHIKTDDIVDKSGVVAKQSQHFGRSGFVPFSIFSYRSWIMHDLYKFLMFCMMGATRNNNAEVFRETVKIFRFFNHDEDPLSALQAQAPVLFALPLTDATNKLFINDLAAYIRTVCDCDFINSQRSNDPILDCEKICLTEGAIFSKIGMDLNGPIGIPDSIVEFYDIAVRLQNHGNETEKIRVAKAFPYQKCMQAHIDRMQNLVRDLVDIRRKLKLVDVGDMTVDQVLNYNTMMIVRSMYVSVGAIIDKTMELNFLYEIGTAVALSYQDNNAIRIMNEIMAQFNRDVKPALEDAKRILGHNNEYLNRVHSDQIVQEAIRRDDRLRWYWEGRNLFDVVFGRVNIS